VGLALLCASYLFWRKPDFPSKGHAYLGIVIAIIGFLSFAFEIASFFNEDLLVVFGVTTLFWGVVAFPVCHTTYYPSTITFFLPCPLADTPRRQLWLLWLGTRLHRVAAIEVIAGTSVPLTLSLSIRPPDPLRQPRVQDSARRLCTTTMTWTWISTPT
jgi:hypothetical protein